jgi:hypothetical protein
VNERERLRREIAKRRKAATDKINRLKKNGINIANTEYDPRQDIRNFKNKSIKELRNYLAELNSFTDRTTTFVSAARGKTISGSAWAEYKELENRYNAIGAQHLESIKDIVIPGSGLTIGERSEEVLSKRAQGDIFNRPYGVINRKSTNIESAESLKKLSDDLRRKLSKSYLPSTIRQQRSRLNELFLTLGNPEWEIKNGETITAIEAANRLSDYQFDIFYNYGGGANTVYVQYAVYSMMNARQSAQYEENFINDIAGLFEWATRLPRNKPRKK